MQAAAVEKKLNSGLDNAVLQTKENINCKEQVKNCFAGGDQMFQLLTMKTLHLFCVLLVASIESFYLPGTPRFHPSVRNWDDSLVGLGYLSRQRKFLFLRVSKDLIGEL